MAFAAFLSGCALTLPFDEISGGAPRAVAEYRFDADEGAVATDGVGRNPGVIQSEDPAAFPKWTPNGKRGGAIEMGTDGWIHMPSFSQLQFPPRGTVAFWLKVHAYDPEGTDLFEANEVNDDTPLFLYLTDKGIFFERSTPSEEGPVSVIPTIPVETWVLVACGWDIPAKQAMLYARVDGGSTYPLQTGGMPSALTVVSPGMYLSVTKGILDEIRVYDHVLTESELKTLD